MEMDSIFAVVAFTAAVSATAAWAVTRSVFSAKTRALEEKMKMLGELHRKEIENAEKLAQQSQQNYDKALERMKETVLAGMTAETEKLLKKRENELADGNEATMSGILKPLKESISAMEKAMKDNAESHLENTAKLSEQLRQAVKEMQDKTADIGQKADTLSEALTGKPKVQGCFGENFLESILAGEGLVEGMHYSREAANEDMSRPDFVFHFKENLEQKDLVVDSKVSLTAFVDYMNAETPQERATALDRHLKSVRKHIDELSRKEYARKTANPFADYVLMFMPRDMAFRVALEADPMIWQEAYRKGVLIATEQTIMPFLKIMQLTWNKFRHDTNTHKITVAAQNMIDRVAAFYDSYTELGKKLKAVCGEYDKGIRKLEDNGQSITTSARQVISIGIRRSKGKEFSVPQEMIGTGEETQD